jgi:UDP-glucose 6-dehydrogenase
MAVSVFGLGYVGCVSAACLAARGHEVIGVDANQDKIEFVRRGQARVVDNILASGKRTIGIFGLAFKAGTDDLRESPMVELAERLIGKGCDVRIYDANVALSNLLGANHTYLEERLPHIHQFLTGDVDEVLQHGEVLIAGTKDPGVVTALDGVDEDTTQARLHRNRMVGLRAPNAPADRKKGSGVSGQSAVRYISASGSVRWPAGAMDTTRLHRPPTDSSRGTPGDR